MVMYLSVCWVSSLVVSPNRYFSKRSEAKNVFIFSFITVGLPEGQLPGWYRIFSPVPLGLFSALILWCPRECPVPHWPPVGSSPQRKGPPVRFCIYPPICPGCPGYPYDPG